MHTKPGVGVSGVGTGCRCLRMLNCNPPARSYQVREEDLQCLSHGGGVGAGRKLLPPSVGSLTVSPALLGIYSLQTPSGSPGDGGGRAGVGRSMAPTFFTLTQRHI